jgi:hypothetical protein
MAPLSFHIFVVNYDGKGVMLIFRLQQFILIRKENFNYMINAVDLNSKINLSLVIIGGYDILGDKYQHP